MPIRNLGYCCINLSLSDKKKKVTSSRTCRMNTFSMTRANDLAYDNVRDLYKIMQWNVQNNIKMFRISSDIFPFITHPKLKYKITDLKDGENIINLIKKIGYLAKDNDIRLCCHPGQYTVLASDNPTTVNNAIADLEMHSLLGSILYNPEYTDFKINIHVGTTKDGKEEVAQRFINNFYRLSYTTQKRLTIENDDKVNCWSVFDLYELIHKPIYKETGHKLPIVLDFHHHDLHPDDFSLLQAVDMAFVTWNDIPITHYSESRKGNNPRAHSDYISKEIPNISKIYSGKCKMYDVEIEAKMKDLALLRYKSC